MNYTLPLPEHCLEIPTPYLIQCFGLQTMLSHQDEAGYGLLHWAVGKACLPKIQELLHAGFSMNCHSTTGEIPLGITHFYDSNSPVKIPNKVHACPLGLTPLQLGIYLHHQLTQRINMNIKGGHTIENQSNDIKEICAYFQKEDFAYTNLMGQSATDLLFLTENLKLIEYVEQIDPDFSTLKSVNLQTAQHILSNFLEFHLKSDTNYHKWEHELIERVKRSLASREQKEKLEKNLILRDNEQTKKVKRGKI